MLHQSIQDAGAVELPDRHPEVLQAIAPDLDIEGKENIHTDKVTGNVMNLLYFIPGPDSPVLFCDPTFHETDDLYDRVCGRWSR